MRQFVLSLLLVCVAQADPSASFFKTFKAVGRREQVEESRFRKLEALQGVHLAEQVLGGSDTCLRTAVCMASAMKTSETAISEVTNILNKFVEMAVNLIEGYEKYEGEERSSLRGLQSIMAAEQVGREAGMDMCERIYRCDENVRRQLENRGRLACDISGKLCPALSLSCIMFCGVLGMDCGNVCPIAGISCGAGGYACSG